MSVPPTQSLPDAPHDAPLTGIDLGASLTVKDLESSLAWYTTALGFSVDRTFEREGKMMAASLKAGAVRVLLTQDNGARGMSRDKGQGFSLQITTTQNIDDIASRVVRGGSVLESEPADAWGMRVFRVRDPDGFLFVISSPRPA